MRFAEMIHAPEFEGKEKHVPDISVSEDEVGTVVTVKIGKEVLHPTSKDHHIEWVKIFGETQDGKVVEVGVLDFGQGTSLPKGSVTIDKDAYKSLTALSYCNMHGVWDNSFAL
ncbi:desulfoferrodoxin [candidate division KSB3 bacterium]|uniref:Desulfoferrodoxin n=1 Tax=candidate division KSB3 bacterium TaxID=2044937 RepID=A0A9D5JTL6_9BACT|nr:desulfoferrodoxin [candidate division KSB3 bacterium]MBD3323987.1 desulfoferrodoxin [candidate division KSB3 bacterium]